MKISFQNNFIQRMEMKSFWVDRRNGEERRIRKRMNGKKKLKMKKNH